MKSKTPILSRIPPDMLTAYKQRKITSYDVAKHLDVNPASVRRAIPDREPLFNQDAEDAKNRELRRVRNRFRATLAHKPVKEIMQMTGVSISTAYRIKNAGKPQS